MQDWRIYLVKSTRTALLIAAAMIALLAMAGFIADALELFPVPLTRPALLSAGVGFFTLGTSWVLMQRAEASGSTRRLTFITFGLLALTVMLATILFGGIASVLPYAYTPIILAVAILLGMRPALQMATICLMLHGITTVMEIYQLFEPVHIWGVSIPLSTYPGVGYTVLAIAAIIFYMVAWVAGALSDLLAEQNRSLGAGQELMRQEIMKTQFLSTVAHELRTPLTSARGYLHLVNAGMIPPERMKEILSRIQENVETITGHVNDLMFLQEVELVIERSEQIDLVELAQDVLNSYKPRSLNTGITLQLEANNHVPVIKGDQNALVRAVTALVDNAVKYSPNGGDVFIRVGSENGHVHMSIEDHGIGIETKDLPHIFERFYHVDKSTEHIFGGMGVGLPIAQRLIRAHGGDIGVSSRSGEGSTFTIWLPVK
ncbi:MAG: HAMP domain-containing histidine kinase [Chloroflexi bacterium]|nr:HAMP domain-containing histidine kinase [Chloroflexota bacterium]MBP8055541.1 HAMP domain-containing histidine kinase [Chloroflexota bacterium]